MSQYLPNVMLLVLVLLAAAVLWVWQKNHEEFDLADLLTGENGKVSLAKFGQASALVVSTWGFVSLIQQGKMTEYYFMGYMIVWAGYRVASQLASKPQENHQ